MYTDGPRWGMFCGLDVIEIFWKADTFLDIRWNTKHFIWQ